MSIFQVLLLAVVAVLGLLAVVSLARGWSTWREGVVWLAVVAAAAVAVTWPDLTTRIAREVGIRRGADLVLYCSVVVMTTGFLMLYARLRHLRREITLLVRHVAIIEAREADAGTGG
ncbi:MAG: DUF2304 family protein [Planctomycetota bacterium]|jgi:hypothetical protein